MSQNVSGISLAANPNNEAFKLLELPAELLQQLESENPPTMYLKSAEPTTPNHPGYAVLSTGDKSYRIQQKSSSNPIMILRPSTSMAAGQGLTRISVLEDTLELTAEKDGASATSKARKWHEKFAKDRAARS